MEKRTPDKSYTIRRKTRTQLKRDVYAISFYVRGLQKEMKLITINCVLVYITYPFLSLPFCSVPESLSETKRADSNRAR